MKETEMNQELIEQLEAEVANLRTTGAKSFATSLLTQYARKRDLSPKQWAGVRSLIEQARTPAPTPIIEDVGSFAGVYALMHAARAKRPKLRMTTEDHYPVVLSVAGPQSKYPGQINASDGGPYGQNRWYGRINAEGQWAVSRTGQAAPQVGHLLRSLAENPAEVLAERGKATGHCCMCGRHLEDERSMDVGYGPVCAENWGLPWGGKINGTPVEKIEASRGEDRQLELLAEGEDAI